MIADNDGFSWVVQRPALCHYPFRTWRNMSRGWRNLHGHSHGRLKPLPRQTDVGVDAWDFRPVTLVEIIAIQRPRARAKQST
jgi:calcineurin-like phosphoesterase family protein